MWTILADVQLTRRQRMNHVFDETENVRWSGKTIASAIHFCVEASQTEIRLEGENHHFVLNVTPVKP